MNRLQGKVAIVTGGASGIGKATAQRFLQEGATVAIWDINEASGKALATEWAGQGMACKFYKVNTADMDAVQAGADAVMQDFGQIDILINNAGITRDSSLKKMSPLQWQQVIDVNLSGVFYCTKVVSGYMSERNYGRIINAASVVALYGNFGQTNYVASKAGVIGMTKVWARELGRKGITVNAIAPGFIKTEMVETIPAEYMADLESRTPVGRMGMPEDVANAYLFLASDEASFINGVTLSVDGGLVL